MPMSMPTLDEHHVAQLIDRVAATGEVVEIQRPAGRVRISRAGDASRLGRLHPHPDAVEGDPADLAELSWADDWRPVV